jgi:hypothetical protein
VKKGAIDFRLRASLPIVSDYDPKEAPTEYFRRKSGMPVSFLWLPGGTPYDIGETVSEYLGFREVEKWADKENPTYDCRIRLNLTRIAVHWCVPSLSNSLTRVRHHRHGFQ